jgi:hypothetical protein
LEGGNGARFDECLASLEDNNIIEQVGARANGFVCLLIIFIIIIITASDNLRMITINDTVI